MIKIPLPEKAGEDAEMEAPATPLISINLQTGIADVQMDEPNPGAMIGEDLYYEEEEEDDANME